MKDTIQYDFWETWDLDAGMLAAFEIPIAEVKRLLPSGLHALELRPGIGLMNVVMFSYPKNSLELHGEFPTGHAKPELDDLIAVLINLHVVPDLSFDFMPTYAQYTVSQGSTSPVFQGYERDTNMLPSYMTPLEVELNRKTHHFSVRADGKPILELENFHAAPRYVDSRVHLINYSQRDGQVITVHSGMDGLSHEHQNASGGVFHEHEFFGGLDVSQIDTKRCYLQMTCIEPSKQFYYPPGL